MLGLEALLSGCCYRQAPAQLVVELTCVLELLHPLDPEVARTVELVVRQAVASVRLVQLLDAAANGPARLEPR